MKAVVFTLGCKVNACESGSLMTGLKELGYEVSSKLEPADLYIINTCAVTKEAERKSRQAISRVRKFSPLAKIIVCGCASQKCPQDFLEKEGVYLVTGAINKEKILELINDNGIFIDDSCQFTQKYYPLENDKTRHYIKIQDGCNNFCSYCVIPYLRGRSRSRNLEDIVNEVENGKSTEIVLTGINLSAYNDNGRNLADLIGKLKNCSCRIRLGSLEDNIIDDRLLSALSNLKDFAEHFHLSLQSGSDKVLKEMNRHYSTEDFFNSVKLIKKYFPNAAITTDVIAGYSTETDADFEQTINFCKQVQFSDIHCFEYSRREGTVGYKLKPVANEIKKQRLNRLLDLKKLLKQEYLQKFIGRKSSFVPERYLKGYTEGYTGNYIRVYVPEKCLDGIKQIELLEPFEDGLKAKLID